MPANIEEMEEMPVSEIDTGVNPNLRWEMTEDGDGNLHLIDMSPVEEIEPHFNAATDVHFLLHTRRNRTAGQRLTQNAQAIRDSQWNTAALGTRFIVHGWNNNGGSPVNVRHTNAILDAADHNVVRVDWGAGANAAYATSRGRVMAVGQRVGQFIVWLNQNGFLPHNRAIIIGHSLGAHIAGNAARSVTNGNIAAVFGLDPAGPSFAMTSTDRLRSTDAVYTEMMATNTAILGFTQPLADATFYPNGGSSQPGCGVDIAGTCAHSRAVDYMVESIARATFPARRCANLAQAQGGNCAAGNAGVMGGNAAKSLSGIFWLRTNSGSPFGIAGAP